MRGPLRGGGRHEPVRVDHALQRAVDQRLRRHHRAGLHLLGGRGGRGGGLRAVQPQRLLEQDGPLADGGGLGGVARPGPVTALAAAEVGVGVVPAVGVVLVDVELGGLGVLDLEGAAAGVDVAAVQGLLGVARGINLEGGACLLI